MRKISTVLIAGAAMTLATTALAQTAAPATAAAPAPAAAPVAAAKLSSDSTVRALLADARSKAILQKHVPLIVEHAPEYPEINDMSLKTLAGMTEAQTMAGLTADVLKKIEADLAAL